RGRGSENKVPFIAAVQISPEGHPVYAIFSRVKTFGKADVAQWSQLQNDFSELADIRRARFFIAFW
ncbi:hypothetical protein F1735_34815, partial [Massilia sp. CCM 8694]|nr:hypothetical protein [Massilia genomosp. 1]